MINEIKKMDEYLCMVGEPRLGNVTIKSNNEKVNLYDVGTLMEQKGWLLGTGAP